MFGTSTFDKLTSPFHGRRSSRAGPPTLPHTDQLSANAPYTMDQPRMSRALSTENLAMAASDYDVSGSKPNRVQSWVSQSTNEAPPSQNEPTNQIVRWEKSSPQNSFGVWHGNVSEQCSNVRERSPSGVTYNDDFTQATDGKRQGETFAEQRRRLQTLFHHHNTGRIEVPEWSQGKVTAFNDMLTAIGQGIAKAITDQLSAYPGGNPHTRPSVPARSFVQPIILVSIHTANPSCAPRPFGMPTPSISTLAGDFQSTSQYRPSQQASRNGSYVLSPPTQTLQSALGPRIINGGSVIDRRIQQPIHMATGGHSTMPQFEQSRIPQLTGY